MKNNRTFVVLNFVNILLLLVLLGRKKRLGEGREGRRSQKLIGANLMFIFLCRNSLKYFKNNNEAKVIAH